MSLATTAEIMSWQGPIVLLATHSVALAIGWWVGKRSLRRYKKALYQTLYSGSHFKNPLLPRRLLK
jgi:hypothetical protein